MIKKFENFDEELLDTTTLIQILEQIYDDLDDVDVYLSSAGGFAQSLEEWNWNKDGFRFSNLYDADLNWKLRLNSDIRSLKQYVNILNVMSPILDHIQGFGWKVCEIKSTKKNNHIDLLFTSILFEFKKI